MAHSLIHFVGDVNAMRSALVTAIVLLAGSVSLAASQRVEFLVHVPADTPNDAKVFVAGSVPALGTWRPDGLPLVRQPNGTYTAEVDLATGQSIEFKITRGTWATVEKNADGSDRPNRAAAIAPTTQKIEVAVTRWANGKPAPRPPSTVVGTLKLHDIDSRHLKQPRTIRVWLPPGYDANPNARYDVLYMHDGQNCFDRATSAFGNEWGIDESMTKLIAAKEIPPLIVVGIDNGLASRINELTFTADAKRGGGQAAAYTAFLLEEVKPFVERTYRTNTGPAHTLLGGSSLGGLVSLEIARRHPETFGGVLAMSPALQWADESLTREIERDPAGLRNARIWLDVGTHELGAPPNATNTTADPAKSLSKYSLSDGERVGVRAKTPIDKTPSPCPLPKGEGSRIGSTPQPAAADSTAPATGANDANAKLLAAAKRLDAALTKHHISHQFTIDGDHPAHNEPAWAARFPQAVRYVINHESGGNHVLKL